MSRFLPTDPEIQRRRGRLLTWFFLFASVVLIERAGHKRHGVLDLNQGFGARFLAHEDPYFDPAQGLRVHGPYPPSYVLVCAPLSLLPAPLARRVWAGIQILCLSILYRLLRRRLERWNPTLLPHAPFLYLCALLLASRFLLRDMAAGGGNLIYATLTLAGVELALAGRAFGGALPLALALAVKPNQILFLLFLCLRRRWKAAAGTLLALFVLALLPGLYYGMGSYLELWHTWVEGVWRFASLPDLHDKSLVPPGLPPEHFAMNQALRVAVFRLLRPPGDSGAYDVHLWTTSAATALWVGRALALFLLAWTSAAAWRACDERGEWLAALAFFPLGLLLSPITWKAHHVVLIPALFAVTVRAAEPTRRGLRSALLAAYLLFDLSATDILGQAAGDYLQAISLVTLGDVVLLAYLLRWLCRRTRCQEAVEIP